MSSPAQDHDAFSGIKDAFTSMIKDLEDTQITKKDRTTTAGGISIADFKREAALRRYVNHNLPRGMTEFSTLVKGVFTQYKWNPKDISNVSRVSDVTDTVLDLVKKDDADSADLVLKLSYLQSQSRIYSKDELDTMRGTLSQALKTYPEHSSVWIPGIQTLARAKRMSSVLSTALRIKDSMAEFNCKLVMELAELEGLPEETIMVQEGYKGEAKVAVEAVLARRRAEAAALKEQEDVSVDDLLSAMTVTSDV